MEFYKVEDRDFLELIFSIERTMSVMWVSESTHIQRAVEYLSEKNTPHLSFTEMRFKKGIALLLEQYLEE